MLGWRLLHWLVWSVLREHSDLRNRGDAVWNRLASAVINAHGLSWFYNGDINYRIDTQAHIKWDIDNAD